MRYLFPVLLLILTACATTLASPYPITINIWNKLAPGETTANPGVITSDHSGNIDRMTEVTFPQLLIYGIDDNKTHPAVLVFPGGGYSILAVDLEGSEIAKWLNSIGFVAAVLHYRVPNNREGAFQDAERAMSLIRAESKKYRINPKEIGVIGFSAGGHLAARLSCEYEKRAYEPVDRIDKVSCRPDFAMLIYPAYLIDGNTGKPAPEVTPHKGMPPMFLVQTMDDPFLDAPAYAKFLEKSGVKTKLCTYEKGGHGYGLRTPADNPLSQWPKEAEKWLNSILH